MGQFTSQFHAAQPSDTGWRNGLHHVDGFRTGVYDSSDCYVKRSFMLECKVGELSAKSRKRGKGETVQ